jgi:hypothetical protein
MSNPKKGLVRGFFYFPLGDHLRGVISKMK